MSEHVQSQPRPSNAILLWISESILLAACFTLAAFFFTLDLETYVLYEGGASQILGVTLLIQIGLWLNGLYSFPAAASRTMLIFGLLQVLGISFLCQAVWSYVNPALQFPREGMFYGSLFVLLIVPLWRTLFLTLQDRATDSWRLLLIGDSPVIEELARLGHATASTSYFKIAAHLTAGVEDDPSGLEELDQIIQSSNPTHVVIAGNLGYTREFLDLQWAGLKVLDAQEFYESTFHRIPVGGLRPADFVLSNAFFPERPLEISRLIALIVALASSPLALLLALAIRTSSKGPVLTRSSRRGHGGKSFQLLEFRVPETVAAGQPPTPTKLGRWMRRFRLQQIPGLLNVIRGEMSFFGPRPFHPEIAQVLEREIPIFRFRNNLRPGLAGWAELNLPATAVNPIDEVAYDLYYIKNRSLALNFYILGHGFDWSGSSSESR